MVEPAQPQRAGVQPLVLVAGAIALQIVGAVLLKWLADLETDGVTPLLVGGMAAVLALNGLRFGVWSLAHSRFPVVRTVPYAALFFPAMLPVAVAFGDSVGASQILGAVLITAGAALLQARDES